MNRSTRALLVLALITGVSPALASLEPDAPATVTETPAPGTAAEGPAPPPETPPAGPAYFGLAFHGAYVQRAEDGSLDCARDGEALRLSLTGDILGEADGIEEVEFGEINVLLPGPPSGRQRVRYGLIGSWFYFGDDLWDGATHITDINAWFCAGLGCHTRGEGELHLYLEPDGDITLLRFHWRARWDTPRTVYAGGEAGMLRMGHCPALG